MPSTVPNQRLVQIHRERASANFLGIKNDNWQRAARDLGAHALLLYLYFASNADGFQLALSPSAIRQSVGMPSQTYRDQFLKLIDKGYLVHKSGNLYEFFERPQFIPKEENTSSVSAFDTTNDVLSNTPVVCDAPRNDIEINNINIINNIKNKRLEKQVSPPHQFQF